MNEQQVEELIEFDQWDDETIEDFFNDVEKMNIMCDEFNQTNYTV
mgnify:CR=1 FL=1